MSPVVFMVSRSTCIPGLFLCIYSITIRLCITASRLSLLPTHILSFIFKSCPPSGSKEKILSGDKISFAHLFFCIIAHPARICH